MSGTKRIAWMIGCLFLPLLLSAQTQKEIETAPPWQLKNYAKKALARGDSYSALDYTQRYVDERPNKIRMVFELADLYRETRDYRTALHYYQVVVNSEPGKIPLARYHLAEMQMQLAAYDTAKMNFEAFLKEYKGGSDYKTYKKRVSNFLLGCEIAPALLDSVLKVQVDHLDTSINKAHIEFSPIPIDDHTMVYASLKADSVKLFPVKSDSVELPVKKFYLAQKTVDGWHNAGEWKTPFNQPGVHTGNGAFSMDGNRFYFTRCTRNWQGKRICTIYQSQRENGGWSDPLAMEFGINHPKFSSTQPTVGTETAKGREVLYFISDRPGGRGGKDVWYSQYDPRKQGWSTPKNAGSNVNTVGDEMTPWYDNSTRSLFFSSDGWPGIGGLDIFKTVGEKNKFPDPVNVGCPFNSSADDLYYVLEPTRDEGFFVSNREGGVSLKNPTCCDDIYFFSWTNYIYLAVEGRVKKAPNGDSSGKTLVSLFLLDKIQQPMLISRDSVIPDGGYLFPLEQGFNYRVKFEQADHFTETQDISTVNLKQSDTLQVTDVVMKRIEKMVPIELKNIYYEFDKATLTPEAKLTLDTVLLRIMRDNPTLIIEVSSHTDSKGTNTYNQDLSRRRAESVVQYLTEHGVDRKRLKSKGYGEEKLRVQDQLPDGTWEESLQWQNRRTEFAVIGEMPMKRVIEEDD